jgi:hypothetical protein
MTRPSLRFAVETRFIDTWENCWTDEFGQPITFASRAEAQAALDDLLAAVREAVAAGDMIEAYDPDDYRLVGQD